MAKIDSKTSRLEDIVACRFVSRHKNKLQAGGTIFYWLHSFQLQPLGASPVAEPWAEVAPGEWIQPPEKADFYHHLTEDSTLDWESDS